MPLFLDRHSVEGVTAHDIAHLHEKDLQHQGRHGVNFLTYWFDEKRGNVFCLVDAPSIEVAMQVHHEAHGEVAADVIPVDLAAVEAFLGRISDPPGLTDGTERESAFRAVLFTDIVDSTGMTARLGDMRAVELIRAHDAIVRRNLRSTGGREIKHTGDGIMASFDSVSSAIECARNVQRGLEGFRLGSEAPLHVGIGIDAGVPVEDSNDLFGVTVQSASRLCASAGRDRILISGSVRKELPVEVPVDDLGQIAFKGLAEPISVFEVGW